MDNWIAEFFEQGHSLDEILNMDYEDYLTIVSALCGKRSGGKSRNLRPIQKKALAKVKAL